MSDGACPACRQQIGGKENRRETPGDDRKDENQTAPFAFSRVGGNVTQPSADDARTLTFMVKASDDELVVPEMPEAASTERFQVGLVIADRYVLERELGRGGMGIVFSAKDRRLDRKVALKVILAKGKNRDSLFVRELFEREAKLGAALMHPGIATVFDYGFFEDSPYIVFEYVAGESLRATLNRRGKIPLDEVRDALATLSQALDYAHSHQIVHRDLKPDNILVTPSGLFKILDLGLAKHFVKHGEWSFAGTPAYASPEQCRELPNDARTDQYSLGVVIYEMLTGRRPFAASSAQELLELHKSAAPPDPRSHHADLPESVVKAVLRTLEKEPGDRFENCQQFAVAMGSLSQSYGVVPSGVCISSPAQISLRGEWSVRVVLWGLNDGYALLSETHIWIAIGNEVHRWPVGAVRVAQFDEPSGTSPYHRVILELDTVTGVRRRRKQLLEIGLESREDAHVWRRDLERLRSAGGPPASDIAEDHSPTVALVKHQPKARFQLLGTVEADARTRWVGEAGIVLRAAMLGADGVSDISYEKLPTASNSHWRVSGTAIKSTDATTRQRLLSIWFGQHMRKAALLLILFSIVLMMKSIFFAVSTSEVPRGILVAFILTVHAWPIMIAAALWKTGSPQLNLPAGLAALALGTSALSRWVSTVFEATALRLPTNELGFLSPIPALGVMFVSTLLFRKFVNGQRVYTDSSSREHERMVRGTHGYIALAVSSVYIGALTFLPLLSIGSDELPKDVEVTANSWASGVQELTDENYADAADHFAAVVEHDPKNSVAWCYLGIARSYTGELNEALDSLNRALELDNSLAEAFRERGRVNTLLERFEAAQRDLDAALELEETAMTLFCRGNLAAAQGEFGDAISDYTKAISLESSLAEAFANRGLCYLQQGLEEEAERDFLRAQQLGFDVLSGRQ